MKMVLVVWEDASQEPGPWVAVADQKPVPPTVFKQVGFLVAKSRTHIELTSSIETEQKGLMAARDRIPRGMVRSITELREVTA